MTNLTMEADDRTRDYDGQRAVDGIPFAGEAGELFGFPGPNGAGKATTIRMLTGQLRPTAGRASVCSYDVVRQRERLAHCLGRKCSSWTNPPKGWTLAWRAIDIRTIVEELKTEGVTVFLTTHYMEEADRLCDRLAPTNLGRIII